MYTLNMNNAVESFDIEVFFFPTIQEYYKARGTRVPFIFLRHVLFKLQLKNPKLKKKNNIFFEILFEYRFNMFFF